MPDSYLSLFSAFVRDLPRFSALAAAVLQQAEDLRAVIPELLETASLDFAEGEQLDMLGESFGLSRSDAADDSDETYRACINAKLVLWRWDGTNQSVSSVLAEAFPGQNVTLTDNGNMTVTAGNTANLPGDPADLLPVPAGVKLEVNS